MNVNIDSNITEYDYEMIYLSDLIIGQEYQRLANKSMIKRIVENYDRHLLDAIRVSFRDGKYYVLDGQHRTIALRKLFGDNIKVWCQVFRDLSYTEEAKLFTMQLSSRRISAIETFKARIESEDPDMILLKKISEKNQFQINSSNTDYCLGCVNALEKLLKNNGADNLDRTYFLLRETWNGDKNFLTAPIIKAISLIIFVYGNDLDNKTFIKALSTVPISQLKREAMSGVTTREYDIALINMYNKSSRRKLDVNKLRYIKNTHKC